MKQIKTYRVYFNYEVFPVYIQGNDYLDALGRSGHATDDIVHHEMVSDAELLEIMKQNGKFLKTEDTSMKFDSDENWAVEQEEDMVNHPSHYEGEIEVIDYLRDKLTQEEFTGFCTANSIKYLSRWRKKGGVEDLLKAQVYLGWAIEHEVEADDD